MIALLNAIPSHPTMTFVVFWGILLLVAYLEARRT